MPYKPATPTGPSPSRESPDGSPPPKRLSAPDRDTDRSAGFTLIELLLAAVIGAFLVFGLVNIFGNMANLSSDLSRRAEIRSDAALAVSLLNRDLSRAERILSVPGHSLTLLTASADTVRYAWSGTAGDTLTRQVNSAPAEPVAANVDTLGFAPIMLSRPLVSERLVTVTAEDVVAKYEETDFESWFLTCDCDGTDDHEIKLEDKNWAGEEFWECEAFLNLSRISLLLNAKDHYPAEVDFIVEVHEAEAGGLQLPGTLIASGRLDRFALPEDTYEWRDVTLTMADTTYSIAENGHYWIVMHADGLGGSTYAGHLQYMEIKGCHDCLPSNGMCYRESDKAGVEWKDREEIYEYCYVLYGLQSTMVLDEVVETVADTIGVEYTLTLTAADEAEHRSGQISLHDL